MYLDPVLVPILRLCDPNPRLQLTMHVTQYPHTWFKARLLAPADNIFSDVFYNEPNRLGIHYVYVAEVSVTPTNTKFLVVSRKERNAIRVMSKELALNCLDPVTVLTKHESQELDELTDWVHL